MEKPTFSPRFWRELAEACPFGPCEPKLVESWFEIAWPAMKARGYRNHKRAVASWWSRIYESDLERAQQRLDAIEERGEREEMRAGYELANDVRELWGDQEGDMAERLLGHDDQTASGPRRRFKVVG